MKKTIVVLAAIIVAVGMIFSYGALYRYISSPEYALAATAKDVRTNGLSGLEGHLTEEAFDTINHLLALTDGPIISRIISTVSESSYISEMKGHISEIEWTIEDVLEGDHAADVIVHFKYHDDLSGNISVKMICVDGEWKINGVGLPQFE